MLQKIFKPSPYNKTNIPQHLKEIPEHDAGVFVLWAPREKLKSSEFFKALQDFLLSELKAINEASTFWIRVPEIKSFSLKDRQSGSSGSVIVAMIRVRDVSPDIAKQLQASIQNAGYEVQALKVKNSVPLDAWYKPSLGEQSPDLVSVSFFKAKKALGKERFWDYWFNSHTPFALDIHPLCHYERNRVLANLEGSTPVFDAIVPLHLVRDEDLKFSAFFSHDGRSALGNALRIYNDVKQFIELSGIETVAMRQFVVK